MLPPLVSSQLVKQIKKWMLSYVLVSSQLIFHIFGALAEFERNLIRERTHAGLQAARARGRKGGRPKSLDKEKQALVVKLYGEKKHTIKQICQIMGISKPTLYKYIEAAKQD